VLQPGHLQSTDGYASFVRAIDKWKRMATERGLRETAAWLFLPHAVSAKNTSEPFDSGSVELTEKGVP
jgi:hypothetical protein